MIDSKLAQPRKHPPPKEFIPSGKTMDLRLMQSPKVLFSRETKPFGKTTFERLPHSLKQPTPMDVILFDKIIVSNEQSLYLLLVDYQQFVV